MAQLSDRPIEDTVRLRITLPQQHRTVSPSPTREGAVSSGTPPTVIYVYLRKSLTLWIKGMREPTSAILSCWVKYWDKLSSKSLQRRVELWQCLKACRPSIVMMWPQQQLWAAFIITRDSRGKRPCHQFVILNMSVSFWDLSWDWIAEELGFCYK